MWLITGNYEGEFTIYEHKILTGLYITATKHVI